MSESHAIKHALERAIKTVTLRPERGQRVYRNVATVREGTQCLVEEAGRSLILDVGKALGGQDAGPTPSMVLRSAMSGCVAIGIKQWVAYEGLPVDQVTVALETEVDARGQLGVCKSAQAGFERIRMAITVRSAASPSAIEEVVALSLEHSPLMDVFSNSQSVDHSLSVTRPDTVAKGAA